MKTSVSNSIGTCKGFGVLQSLSEFLSLDQLRGDSRRRVEVVATPAVKTEMKMQGMQSKSLIHNVHFNPFKLRSPNIHIQILLTDLHTFSHSISWENLLRDQSNFPLLIILLILITFSLDYLLILWGEIWCWALLGLKGLTLLGAALPPPPAPHRLTPNCSAPPTLGTRGFLAARLRD